MAVTLTITATVTGTKNHALHGCFVALTTYKFCNPGDSHTLLIQVKLMMPEELWSIVDKTIQFPVSSNPSSGLGNAGERFSTCPQIWPPWYAALRICWCNAACVGGSLSIDRPFFVNNCFLAKSIHVQVLVPSYSSMTKRSMLDKQAVDGLSGALHSCSKLSDTSGKLTQDSQALRLPWPRNEEDSVTAC